MRRLGAARPAQGSCRPASRRQESAPRRGRCGADFRGPYGARDDADEDPTHARHLFLYSFYYLSPLGCTHADYGYRGDWDTGSLQLTVDAVRQSGKDFEALLETVRTQRNVVLEMEATLHAVKPIRSPGSAASPQMKLAIRNVDPQAWANRRERHA